MYLLYSLVLSLLFIALLPYFVYQAARRGKYSGSFKARLGLLPASLRNDGRETIWVHAVSVGEFLAARPLLMRLRSDLPGSRIVVSTTTLTGQQLARSQSDLFDDILYFPFDWKFSVRRALDWVNPKIVIILETELWPNFLRECRKRGIVTILANGRISPRSFNRYKILGRPFRIAISDFSLIVMQSDADADRARELGAPPDVIRVCGNLKYDLLGDGAREAVHPSSEDHTNSQSATDGVSSEIDQQFGLSRMPHLIVAGSTAPGEEEMLLASLREVRKQSGLEDARLVLAPRHPERFDEVARLIARSEFAVERRSTRPLASSIPRQQVKVGNSSVETKAEPDKYAGVPDVILLDTIGELASIYRFAAVVFVGGSLIPRGGHNIIEPAAFAKPIVVGPHTENFRQIVSDFVRADAVVQLGVSGGLARELIRLLLDVEAGRAMGARAQEILLRNRGATECTVAMIRETLRP